MRYVGFGVVISPKDMEKHKRTPEDFKLVANFLDIEDIAALASSASKEAPFPIPTLAQYELWAIQ